MSFKNIFLGIYHWWPGSQLWLSGEVWEGGTGEGVGGGGRGEDIRGGGGDVEGVVGGVEGYHAAAHIHLQSHQAWLVHRLHGGYLTMFIIRPPASSPFLPHPGAGPDSRLIALGMLARQRGMPAASVQP